MADVGDDVPKAVGKAASAGSSALASRIDHDHALDPNIGLQQIQIEKNGGGALGTRRRVNFIEGSNVTLTIVDNGAADKVDVTIAASGGAGGNHDILDGSVHQDSIVGAVSAGSIIIGNDTPKWSELVITIPPSNNKNFLAVESGDTKPSWYGLFTTTLPADVGAAAAAGSSHFAPFQDHVHALGIGTTLGDLLIWDATPAASRLAIAVPASAGARNVLGVDNGDTTASWKANDLLADGDGDTKIQVEESVDEDLIRFDVAGSEVFRMTNVGSIVERDGAGTTDAAHLLMQRSRSGGAVAGNDIIAWISAYPHDGADFDQGAQIRVTATETHTATAHGQQIEFLTVADGTTNPQSRVKIDQDGIVYVTGALVVGGGGTVDNDVLLKFWTDRSWQFEVDGEGASAELNLRPLTDNRYFSIQSLDSTPTAKWRVHDTDALCELDLTGKLMIDTINEHTTDTGVTIEGILHKDNIISSASGITSTGLIDFGGGSGLIVPYSDSFAPANVGVFGLDTLITNHDDLLKYHDGTREMVVIAIRTADLTTTDGHVIAYDTTSGRFIMEAQAGGGGVHDILHIIVWNAESDTPSAGDTLDGFTNGICVGESGEHGTFTAVRAKATAKTAGVGTNTIVVEADDNPAFSSATTLFTLSLDASTEVDDTVLDNTWAAGDIFLRARWTALGSTKPERARVEFFYYELATDL